MSINPFTHLSNTICYNCKPEPTKTEKANLEKKQEVQASASKPTSEIENADQNLTTTSIQTDTKVVEPKQVINANGQTVGRIFNAVA